MLELTSAEQAFLFPKGLRCSATSELLTHREDTSVHTGTPEHVEANGFFCADEELDGLKNTK